VPPTPWPERPIRWIAEAIEGGVSMRITRSSAPMSIPSSSELVATMALEGGYQELARIVHPHPTISEAIFEAARAVDKWATHA